MPEYVIDHHNQGRDRLVLRSELLDPMHRRHIEGLVVGPGAVVGRGSKDRLDD